MSSFKELRIVDNFYQTSSYFPMPTILISTIDDEGKTTLGAYSLCFPYYVAGKEYYAMLLECRNSSNTAQNILKRGKAALNFLPDSKKYFKETVRLGFPGETSKEKMEKTFLELEEGLAQTTDEIQRPFVCKDAFQVFECTWLSELEKGFECSAGCLEGYEPPYKDFNGITSKFGAHFILKIDKIMMKEKYHQAIINGVKKKDFPQVPVDYGYRDNTHFWYTKTNKFLSEPIPVKKGMDLSTVRYAADRTDPDIHFTDEACEKLSRVPRVFLKVALEGCAKWARELGVKEIGLAELDQINDKRSKEKKN
ncbi:MAG: PCP reductase family protein [Firmicutes bacterium]|nr:PCP reductase family protein [Bacillota bacterium]